MRSMVTVGVAVLIILGLATTGVAQTTYYACVLKDGTIRMVPPDESCRKNETLISWTAGPSGGGGPTVWDSSPEPKQVGVFTASGVWGCPHSVMFKSGDTWFLADIATDGFVGQGPLTFYYMDMECTQGPYLYQYQATYLTKRIVGISPAGIGYYPTGNGQPAPPMPPGMPTPNVGCKYNATGPCQQCGITGLLFEVGEIDLSVFTPPFYLK